MNKDVVATPMEPFTSDEEAGLVNRLDALSVSSLESYIGSAKNSLGNQSLAPTWRPRIEFALRHAEIALVKAQAAAALVEAEPVVVAEAPVPKMTKKAAAAAAAAAAAIAAAAAADDTDAEAESDVDADAA